ncbi:hypothetical protein GE061_014155 [Apolygus lucorum]|uniref:Uncharacterized protein n=1 Tax=Apolygus lucorum TaxID=248454 RepID=A0A6A4K2D4_APOLU|nr:hypothetical protein GE061_014155 [Apolygus lucorum]
MKARCCVLGCGPNTSKKTYPFPPDEDAYFRNEWIKAVGKINWEPAKSSRVCSKHFAADDFHRHNKSLRLKRTAIPTINVGFCDTLKMAKMSAKECVVPTCSAKFSEAPYFHFPKDKALCLKWLLTIPKGSWSLNQSSQVCSRHFEKTDMAVNGDQAWLKTGSVPKFYLESPTILSKENSPADASSKDQKNLDTSVVTSSKLTAPGTSKTTAESTPSTSKKIDDGNIKLEPDDGSESDLEIIEPEIETFEVSDTSDEGEPPPKQVPAAPKAPVVTSLNCKLQINEVRNKTISIKAPGASNGRVIRGDAKIKCCVPRCGSVAGSPPGVGFHSFPQVGETKLSVRSLDNKLTVHDLFSMWKSLLSVPVITKDSYVCTRHFTANDYTVNVLNKVAVPTQFLPTPVTFAPCKVQEKTTAVQPPPLVLLNKSKNPPPILRKAIRPSFTYASPPIRFPGIPTVSKVVNVNPTNNRVASVPTPSKIFRQVVRPASSTFIRVPITRPRQTAPVVVRHPQPPAPPPPPPPVVKKVKLGCSITDCVNKQPSEENKAVLFRLPHNIEKCKEWVYSCGHPEWLDKGMITARSMFRICSLHFANEMFLDVNHKVLKGSAKPTVNVQEPYKKCIVKHCHNYYDKERLHYIGVDFATFPTEPEIFNSWVKSVKNNTGSPSKSITMTDEDVTYFTGAVICSLHFRNSDYIAGPNGKSLSSKAVPTMNLVYVKESEVPSSTQAGEPKPLAPLRIPEGDISDMQYVVPKNRRPYFRSRRGRKRGRRPGWMQAHMEIDGKDQLEGTKDEGLDESLQSTSKDAESADNERVAEDGNEESVLDGEPRQLSLPSRRGRGRGGRRGRGSRRGRRSETVPVELEESGEDSNQSSRRRSSRIETLYGPTGRPLRSAVLKRKSVVESDSESEDSDDESPTPKRERLLRQNSTDSDASASLNRTLRPRRSVARKKFSLDSESDEGSKSDDWQPELENSEPMNYGGGVAEGGHFLDPVLGIEPLQGESVENTSAQPVDNSATSAQQGVDSVDGKVVEQSEDVTMSSVVEKRRNDDVEETGVPTVDDAAGAGVREEPSVDGGSKTDDDGSKTEVDGSKTEADGSKTEADGSKTEADIPLESRDEAMETAVVDEPPEENVSNGAVEPPSESITKENEMESNDSNDAPKETEEEEENGHKDPTESLIPKDKTDDPTKNSSAEDNPKPPLEDSETTIPFGPKLPFPTRADMEFFRSIIPTMATFNDLQKTELRTTIIATLKEMLNEELDIKAVDSKTDESVKNDCIVANVDAIESN